MDWIATHEYADFDAYASMVAAGRLYDGARLMLGRRVIPPVKEFLALHKDRFPAVRYSRVDPHDVDRLVVVDVRRRDRLTLPDDLLEDLTSSERRTELHVWDHHPATPDDLPAPDFERVEPVGAAVTLLVEEIRRRGLAVDPVEATLYALGLYSDTGALSYAGTTGRDARAAAWLLDQGAALPMVNRYLQTAFSREQRQVLARALGSARRICLAGVDVGVVTLELDGFVGGLAPVVRQILQMEGHGALFGVFGYGGKGVQVIGRSRVAYLDVSRVLERLGGGGHQGAGSAKLPASEDPEAVATRLLHLLESDPPRPRRVGQIMSSPVHTVAPDLPLSDLSESLEAWRHSGVPVMRDGELVGIVSRRDVQKARDGDRLHLPVASHMSSQVLTISPQAPLEAALRTMTDADIGRLPVMDDGRLVGILTRTDLTRILYGDDPPGDAS